MLQTPSAGLRQGWGGVGVDLQLHLGWASFPSFSSFPTPLGALLEAPLK